MPPPSEDSLEGVSGILQMAAIIPTRAKFVGETIVASTLASITLGMTFGMFGAAFLPTGPVIPFMVGSYVGHTVGLYNHYRSIRGNALKYAKYYPTIMAHALFVEHGVVVPRSVMETSQRQLDSMKKEKRNYDTAGHFGGIDATTGDYPSSTSPPKDDFSDSMAMALDRWIETSGMKMMSFAILASQFCRNDIEELGRQEREKLIADHYERNFADNQTNNDNSNDGDE